MRIAMVGDEFYPAMGGAPSYTMGLGKALAKLGAEPIVLTHSHRGYPEEEEFGGLKVKRLKGFVPSRLDRAISAGLVKRLHELIKFGGFDVVHGQDIYSPMALQSVYSARKRGMGSILTCHSIHETTGPWKLAYQPLVFTINRADRVIAVSNATGRFCRALGVSNLKIVVVHNGIDLPKLKSIANRASVRARLEIGLEPLIITAIRLVKRKGPENLVTAFSKVLRVMPDAKLAIAGKGPEYTNLRIVIKKLGIENSVFMLGFLPHEQVLELMAAADVFVLPSMIEACPFALLEAMAVGVPTICTRAGGTSEIVENGVNGLMVPPANDDALADAILNVLNDRELAKRLGTKGAATVRKKFTWERTAKQTLAVYEAVSEEHAKRGSHN